MDAVSIGGVAVSLISEPRYTQDVDAVFMLDTDDLPRLVSAAAEEGIVPRVENPVAFATETRVVPFRHAKSGVDVDISLEVWPKSPFGVRL